jgi:hypothetical protein
LIVIVVASDCGFTQDAYTPAAPRILIELPDNIPSDAVWIRYLLSGPGNSGSAIAILKPEPSLRQYVINATFGDKPAAYAKIVVYARGCQFNTHTIEFDDASDVSKHFECDPLPGKIVHGFLPPAQIPSSISAEKKLEISGELEPDWVCDFLLEQRRDTDIIRVGSCLGASISLGGVGDLDLRGRFRYHDP